MISEPDWVRHAIWWRVYPLGFVGAYPPGDGPPATADEHRLRRLIPWLDHVVELGCSGVALGPIFASSGHGYDTIDHFRIDPRLGDDGDFDLLAREAHARGLRLQLDGVFNHVGREHPLAQPALRAGPDADEARWLRTDAGGFVPFEGHDALLTLDHDNPDVRRLVVDVMRHWLDRGADAWRLDAAYAVPTSFWRAVLPEVRGIHPEAWFEAEVIHGDYTAFVEASTVDSVTQYELWKAIWSSINDRNLFELGWALQRHSEMLETFVPATFIGNHDTTRIASRIDDERHLAHAVVLLAVLGGTPAIYAGDEFALRGVKEDRAGGDDAVRPAFPAAPGELAGRDDAVRSLHQRLLGLRRRHAWLHRARVEATELHNAHVVLRLTDGEHALAVTLNLGDTPVEAVPGEILDQDDGSAQARDAVAPHGWRIQRA